MKRQPHWKQDTPREQVVVLVQAAQGELLNLTLGYCINEKKSFERALKALRQAQEILHELPEGVWE